MIADPRVYFLWLFGVQSQRDLDALKAEIDAIFTPNPKPDSTNPSNPK